MVVEVNDAAESAASTGRLMGLADVGVLVCPPPRSASVVAQGDALGSAAGSVVVLESSGLGCCSYPSKAPSGTRKLGNPAAPERF